MVFGDQKTQTAESFGVFNMSKALLHPCRSLSLFDPETWNLERINNGEIKYKAQVLDIGSSWFTKECLVEELGHALFHIPDRWSIFASETIFNNQPQKEPISIFSASDIHLINFLDSQFVHHGMSEYQLWAAYSKYLVSLIL